jgi:hypothetical protein
MSTILSILNGLLASLSKWLDFLQAERNRKLGTLEVENKELREANDNARIANDVDSRPAPHDDSVLDGLRSPTTDR